MISRSAPRVVTLRNLSASYTRQEREIMRLLSERERWFIHAAKHLFGGTLR